MRFRLLFAGWLTWSVCLTVSDIAIAQGLRVSTDVYDIANSEQSAAPQVISSSLTLIHNGRVYDYVYSADEVVVYDPVDRKFTVLNTARGLSTRPTFEEIRHLLDSLRPKTEDYIREQLAGGNPQAKRIAESLQFQMNPQFRQSFDPMKGQLIMTSPSFTYRVETRKWADPEQVEKYLAYADWTARLNAVLHPGSLFPEPRMALNAALRKQNDRMPISVELDLRPNETLRLRAQHQWTQQLSDEDHARIARWEEILNSKTVKEIPFRNYQQAMLISRSR
ncbi:MAG: hypothetical protein ACK58L_00650 [Planctomycetota bacterium]